MSYVAFSSTESFASSGLTGKFAPAWLGAMEKALALAALVALAPVLLAVALMIRLDDGGRVFFRQERHGLGGRIIRIYKFRTMRVMENGASARQATAGDARVTRVGRFLRATSLDELPQLLNVLAGDMALVGPRPHPIALDREFTPLIPGYMARYGVKPGITGLAQVRGHRGPTPDVESMRKRVEADVEYARRKNFALDTWILASTVPAVLRGCNAH